jgi:mRNA-degrading endonuclease toxin of MazEF toxin-antitoxin module
MKARRGDVVLVDFPFSSGGGSKIRPALVIQSDRNNQRLANTIVAQITSKLLHVGEPTRLLIDPAAPKGQQSGCMPHRRLLVKTS